MRKRNAILVCVLAGTVLAGLLLYPVQTLEVRCRRSDKIVFREKVAPGDRFTFAYIHSIEKVLVEGVFAVEADGLLRLLETRFPSYGAGLPAEATPNSAEGKGMVAPSGQRLSEFSFYISPINQPSLHIGARKLKLTEMIDSGEVAVVTVRRCPFLLSRSKTNL